MIDIKPFGRLNSSSVSLRMRHARKVLGEAHIAHYIFTEKQLHLEPARQIRNQLKKGLSVQLTPYQQETLLNYLADQPLTVKALKQQLMDKGLDPRLVEAAAIQGHLKFTINTPWGNHTRLGVNHEQSQHTQRNNSEHTHSGDTDADWGTIHDICAPL